MLKIRDILRRAGLSGFSYRYDWVRDVHWFDGGPQAFFVTQHDLAQAGSDYAVAMLLKERADKLFKRGA